SSTLSVPTPLVPSGYAPAPPGSSPPRATATTTPGRNPRATTCSASSRAATPNVSHVSTSRSGGTAGLGDDASSGTAGTGVVEASVMDREYVARRAGPARPGSRRAGTPVPDPTGPGRDEGRTPWRGAALVGSGGGHCASRMSTTKTSG